MPNLSRFNENLNRPGSAGVAAICIRAELTIARMRLESEQINAEMRRLGQ